MHPSAIKYSAIKYSVPYRSNQNANQTHYQTEISSPIAPSAQAQQKTLKQTSTELVVVNLFDRYSD